MLFSQLCTFFEKLDKTQSRLEITQILSELFSNAEADEIGPIVNLSLGQLRPKFDRLEFGMADKQVVRVIALSLDISPDSVTQRYKSEGDLGLAAATLFSRKTETDSIPIADLFQRLTLLAQDSGAGSQDRKRIALVEILQEINPTEAKYLIRMVLGKLRLGFSDMTILDALSWMISGDKKGRQALEDSYQMLPDIAQLASLVKEHNTFDLDKFIKLNVGTPIIPALAQRLKTADEMIAKMGEVSVDPKYDGTRVQIHFKRKPETSWQVKTFTRNLDESSAMFPELERLGEFLAANEVILDSEAVGYDPKTDNLLPFQITIQRKRKHGIAEAATQIPVKFFIFDILYKDGHSLLDQPLNERYEVLQGTVKDGPFTQKTELLVTTEASEIRKYHAQLLARGLEGAMVKKWSGIYQPGRKGWNWVKFKELEGSAAKLSDTVDAVVMGLYKGEGKRTKFGVGAFLIGVRDKEGNIYTISKVGTGLTDEQWRELKLQSEKYTVTDRPAIYQVSKELTPDIWLDPGIVVEVAADEITKSPIHTAKIALRFPRLVRFRHDKSFDQSTTLYELNQITSFTV